MTDLTECIGFHSEDLEYQPAEEAALRQWILDTVQHEDKGLGNLNFIFCSDEYLYDLNVQYLQHDTYTDVITFPYADDPIEGDIFISVERTADNAKTFQTDALTELHRVVIHGVLHLLGYLDASDEEEQEMRLKENYYLQRRPDALKNARY